MSRASNAVSCPLLHALRTTLVVSAAVLCLVPTAVAEDDDELELSTEIESATVYSRQAKIIRAGKVELDEGYFRVVCDDLPDKFVESSLSVAGRGLAEASIVGIDMRRVMDSEIDSPRYEELDNELDGLIEARESLRVQREAVRRRKQLTESVGKFATGLSQEQLADGSFSATQWKGLLAFFEEESVSTSERENDIEAQLDDLENRIYWVVSEMRHMQVGEGETREVVIDCESTVAGTLAFEISYLVPDASWNPEYTVRYLQDRSEVELTYSARIGQATGEDWNEVPVVLSTAVPHVGAAPPKLSPKQLGAITGVVNGRVTDATTGLPLGYANVTLLGTPYGAMSNTDGIYVISGVPRGTHSIQVSFMGYETETRRRVRVNPGAVNREDFALRESMVSAEEVVVAAERPMIKTEDTATRRNLDEVKVRPINTVADALGTSAGVVLHEGEVHVRGGRASEVKMFAPGEIETAPPEVQHIEAQLSGSELAANLAIRKPVTLETGAEPRRSLVAKRTFPGEFVLEAVPRLSDHVFVRGSLTNPLEFPILPGVAQVYVEWAPEDGVAKVSDYVGEDRLDPVASGEEFTMYMGVDQNVKVERTVEKQVLSELDDKKREVLYKYEITVRSFRKTPATVWVLDRLPVARIEDIEVDDVEMEPVPDEQTEDGLLTWKLPMEPGEERVIAVEYKVEHPATVSSLELGLE